MAIPSTSNGLIISPDSVAAPRRPANARTVASVCKMAFSFLRRHFRELFISEQWHIGIVRSPIHSFLDPQQKLTVEWLPALPRTRFFADPFAVRRGSELVILFEDFDQVKDKGAISAIRSVDGGRTFSDPIPLSGGIFDDPSVHKSYPFLLERDGQVFCVPETFEKNEIALYRAVQFPERWERVCALLPGVDGVDPTVFLHEDRWWMFYTTRKTGTNLKLFLASAPALEGPWSPHPSNPVKTDITGARPGGTPFLHGGVLYRPAQNSGVTYGGSLNIYRITKLTPTEYAEEFVCQITPDLFGSENQHPYPRGLHTLSVAGDLCVIDGKRFLFIPERLLLILKSKLRSLFSRLLPS